MPKLNDMFPSRHLKAADCEDGDLILTMKFLEKEWVGQGEDREEKWVLYFADHDKGLVLNKTNSNSIAKLYGNDTDDWVGKQVCLFATEVQFGKDMVEAIRVRSKAPKQIQGRRQLDQSKVTPKPMSQAEVDGVEAENDIPF